MHRRAWMVVLPGAAALAALAGCHVKPDPSEQARQDARAVAMVEAAQKSHPPAVSLEPQPWSAAEIAAHRLTGSVCRLREVAAPPLAGHDSTASAASRDRPVVIANAQRAMIKVDGRIMLFAADAGSGAQLPGMVRHYVGKSHSLLIDRQAGDGTALGAEALTWAAKLTIRDAWDQIVHASFAELTCGP